MLTDVQLHYKNLYGRYKYNKIPIRDDEGDELSSINLRISDHTENIFNVDRFNDSDYHISVVISDFDPTKNRFSQINSFERRIGKEFELKFNSDNQYEEIIGNIDDLIENITEKVKDKYLNEMISRCLDRIL